jgi:hypothetical protein
MNLASQTLFATRGFFGTQVPKPLKTFVWHQEATRTISTKGRFRKT